MRTSAISPRCCVRPTAPVAIGSRWSMGSTILAARPSPIWRSMTMWPPLLRMTWCRPLPAPRLIPNRGGRCTTRRGRPSWQRACGGYGRQSLAARRQEQQRNLDRAGGGRVQCSRWRNRRHRHVRWLVDPGHASTFCTHCICANGQHRPNQPRQRNLQVRWQHYLHRHAHQ